MLKIQLRSKLCILLIILISLYLQSNCDSMTDSITKDDSFWVLSNNPEIGILETEIKLCFRNLDHNTKYLSIQEKSPNINISDFIDKNTIKLSQNLIPTEDIYSNSLLNLVDEIVSIEINKISIKIRDDILLNNLIRNENTYCITFMTKKPLNSFKNLSLIAESSFKNFSMVRQKTLNFSSFNYYNALTSESLIAVNNKASKATANLSEEFEIEIDYNTVLPENKEILLKNSMEVIITLKNIDISLATVSITPVDNNISVDKIEQINYNKIPTLININSEKESQIKLYNFSHNLVNNMKFKLTIKKIKFIAFSVNKPVLTTKILWKNTNSVISRQSLLLSITPMKYKFDETKITFNHINDYPYLYNGGTFPMELSFILNESSENDILIRSEAADIFTNNKDPIIRFIPSTCEFYLTTATNSFCKEEFYRLENTKSNSILRIRRPRIIKNIAYKIRFWILVSKDLSFETLNHNVNISVEVENFSEIFTFQKSKLPLFIDVNDSREFGAVNNNECFVLNSQDGCNAKFRYLSERTNGIVFLNETGNADILKNLNSSIMRMDFIWTAHKVTPFPISNWAIEKIDKSVAQSTNINNFLIKGKHSFYFPKDFVSINLETSSTFSWHSTNQVVDNPQTQGLKIYSKLNSFTNLQARHFTDNSIVLTSLNKISSNLIEVTNFNSVTDDINLGLFISNHFAINQNNEIVFNNNSYNASLNGYVRSSLVFNMVKLTYTDPRSVFTNFDFFHIFTRKSDLNPIRINRFLNLTPQKGMFLSSQGSSQINPIKFYESSNTSEVRF